MSCATGMFCEKCGARWSEGQFRLTCASCNSPLEIKYDLERMKSKLSLKGGGRGSRSVLKKWMEILPIDTPELIDRVYLGEDETPLIRSSILGNQLGIENLFFKMEFMGPTLSLKDRGTSLCALKALELGYDTLCIPSSGNNAASVAAYAAKAGLKAVVFIQKNVSPAKVYKIIAYGATVVRVDGDMNIASKVCAQMLKSHRWFQCSGANPYRFTAKRTVAYEIIEQLGGLVPDAVVFPVGGATGMASACAGFLEMRKMEMIHGLPRFIGVQLEACDPITRAFDEGSDEIRPVTMKPSISDAIMNNNPFHGMMALKAARETNGIFVSVSDQEFVHAIQLMASREGLFLEPAGAVSVAGIRKLLTQERVQNLRTVVCMLTGHGLNSPQAALEPDVFPEVIEPEVSAVESYLKMRT